VNWVTFKCGVIDGTLTSAQLSLDPGQGDYGDYGHWSGLCELSKYTHLTQGPFHQLGIGLDFIINGLNLCKLL